MLTRNYFKLINVSYGRKIKIKIFKLKNTKSLNKACQQYHIEVNFI